MRTLRFSMRSRAPLLACVLAPLLSVCLHLPSAGAVPASKMEKVVLAMPTVINVQYSDFAFGNELGFFRDEGIDLQMVAFQGSGVAVPQVVNKSAQFGMTESSLVITAQAKDEPLPVRFVYSYLRTNVNDFAVLADGPIKSLADMKGRKLGVGSLTFASVPMSKAAFKDLGITWQKDVEIRPVGVGAAAWKQLETGQVDALNLYLSEDVRMRLSGLKIRQISYPDSLRAIFAQAMMTHQDTIRDRPDLVAAMGRAMAKSTVACAAAREACARAYWKFDPTSKPAPDKEAEWMRNTVTILEAQYASIGNFVGGAKRWGEFSPDTLTGYLGALKDADLIKRADITGEQVFTNQFIDEFNKFDAAAVGRQAKEFEQRAAK